MKEGFEVDLVDLSMRREEFSSTAQEAADLPVVDAVRATPAGLPGTRTAAATQELSQRLGRGVTDFAGIVGDLAERLAEVERVYHATDLEASEQLEQVLGPWAEQ